MFVRRSGAVVLLLLLPGLGGAEDFTEEGDTEPKEVFSSPAPSSPGTPWASLFRMEATTLTLLPRHGARSDEGFMQVEPMAVVNRGATFHLNVGAPVRLRLWGGGVGTSFVRKEDWDTLSDWGQVVRILTLGSDASPASLWMGSLDSYTLLSGHLVRRYNNRGNPDYHPAGVVVTGTLGPVYTEAFASDMLGARLTGAEVALDLQHFFFGRPPLPGRYTLALSAVHDWGRAGGVSRPLTLAHLDGTAVVLRRRSKG
ncbi:hypothetical protein D7Y13_41845, partial [Corallococcus praedator]